MSALRVREKFGWFVCITLLIILSCRGVQSQKDEEEPEPEPAFNIPGVQYLMNENGLETQHLLSGKDGEEPEPDAASNIPAASITCDVEDRYTCGYKSEPGTWTFTEGMYEKFPHADHSVGLYAGKYFLSRFDKGKLNQHVLLSPRERLSGHSCLSFHYSFHGSGEFKIYDIGKKKRTIKPHNINTWAEARISVQKGEHQFAFVHNRGNNQYTNDILRLDSIKISKGTCNLLVCEEGWWKCSKSDICIPKFKVCDREADCLKSEDEDNCVKYSKVRLYNGRNAKQGRVEIYHQGSWRKTCGYWSQSNADVVCRELGYTGTAKKSFPGNPTNDQLIKEPIASVMCNGYESSISKCSISKCTSLCTCNMQPAVDCSNSHCPSTKIPCRYVNETLTPRAHKRKCVYKESVCDGEKDCPGDTDEKSCPKCDRNQFQCLNYECIPQEQQCDGIRNCKSGSDEFHCLKHSNNTMMFLQNGAYIRICENNLKYQKIANTLCQYVGKGDASVGPSVYRGKGILFTYRGAAARNPVLPGYKTFIVGSCKILNIICNKPECGTRSSKLYDPMILYGQDASPGEFPWQAALYLRKMFMCGAAIVDRWHVLTAAHCIDRNEKPKDYSINVGSVNIRGGKKYYISKISSHPNYIEVKLHNDIAVLRVTSPIVMTDYIRPICLPSKPWVPQTQCFLSGWGRMQNNRTSTRLQEAKVLIQSRTICKQLLPILYYSMICADNDQPYQTGCNGDSGSPLVCRNTHGYWEVVGLVSFGHKGCRVAHSFYPPPPPSGGNIGKEPLLYPEIQKRTSFRYYYVTHDGKAYNYKPSAPSIPIAATEGVPDDAMRKAADIVSHMTKNSPDEVFSALTGFLGVGLFTAEEGLSVYPEHARYADRPECYGRCDGGCADTCMANGQKWNKMAGMTIGRTVVLDDNVMCSAEDPYQHTENILNHEFAHLVEEALPKAWHDKLEAAYRNAYANRLWTLGTYAMQSAREYFGEATEAWFYASMRTDVTGGLNMCGTRQVCKSEKDVRDYIQQHDPQLFEVLSYAYTNGRPELEGGIGPCAKEFYEAIIGDN